MRNPYPLQWPNGKPRTGAAYRRSGQFRVTLEKARDELYDSLAMLGADDATVTSERAKANDPGVAVYFFYGARERVMACDRYEDFKSNLRAVGNSIEALRTMKRHGTDDIVEQALEGFSVAALPMRAGESSIASKVPWFEVLGVMPTAPIEVIEGAYRTLAAIFHPDKASGDNAKFLAITAAIEEARAIRQALKDGPTS